MGKLAIITGWLALLAFMGLLATCSCAYRCEKYFAGRAKMNFVDSIFCKAHKAHNWLVWLAIVTVFVHIALAH